ncbi:MAG: leucyl aminopeptidase [Tissierellia bacterium]|nr:leucyl aminopeptidase [Tissierellia bacterium]
MKLILNKESKLMVRVAFEETVDCSKVRALREKNLFNGKYKEFYPFIDLNGEGRLFLGLGKESELTTLKLTEAFFFLSKEAKKLNISELGLKLPKSISENRTLLLKALEGILQEEYKWEDYKSEKTDDKELTVLIPVELEGLVEEFEELKNLIKGVKITRDLVNIPSNDLYPQSYSEKIKEIFKGTNVEVEVYDDKQCQEMGMEAMLQVGRGSEKKPRLIIMKYLPVKEEKEHLTFVGKGLTYDSGGYAIKPPTGMVTMKCDMAGSGAVVGALYALQKNNIQKNVVGVVAAVENMISGDAYKNGDIIGSMKGLTIEVGNTDAEGRITLADALYYAATKLETKAIVDLATLTGACVVALGEKVTGFVSNNEEMSELMLKTSKETDEHMHRFEIFETHREQVKGKFGDLKNSTTGGAGSITAGVFLEHFVENKPWVHLDIAGPAYTDNAYSYIPAGGTGHPVKTIYEFAKKF